MKLFFSYGHDDNAEIVNRLAEDLRKDGHEVWIDTTNIRSGDDWRRKITEGITKSELTMAFASKHSVRDPGVCLDELKIAVCVKGAQIQSVILEKGVKPPRSTRHKQDIEMFEWKAHKENGTFDKWYTDKLQEIKDILNLPEVKSYDQEMTYIKKCLNPDLTEIKFDNLKAEVYYERKWLSKIVNNWIINTNEHFLLIEGTPGSGKSSFMAHEFIFNPDVGIIVFCEWNNSSFNNIDSISRNLVFQLAAREPDYRRMICSILEDEEKRTGSFVYKPNNSDGIFRNLLMVPLRSKSIFGTRKILILIDGLDETVSGINKEGYYRNAFVETLQAEIKDFPEWVRFIATSRPDKVVTGFFPSSTVIHIDDKEENSKDIHRFINGEIIKERNRRKEKDNVDDIVLNDNEISMLVNQCAGNFLYARIALDSIIKNNIRLEELTMGENGDLGYIYRKNFERTFDNRSSYTNDFLPIISLLTLAEEAVPKDTLMLFCDYEDVILEDRLNRISSFISASDDYYQFFHKSVRDWLLSNTAMEFKVYSRSSYRIFSKILYKKYSKSYKKMNLFELKYMQSFMEKCDFDDLEEVNQDREFAKYLIKKSLEEYEKLNFSNAIPLAQNALTIYKSIQDVIAILETLSLLAKISERASQYKNAKEYCKAAKEYENAECDNENKYGILGDIYKLLADLYFTDSNWEDSISAFNKALASYKSIDLNYKQIECLLLESNAFRYAQRDDDATKCIEEVRNTAGFDTLRETHVELYIRYLLSCGWLYRNKNKNDKRTADGVAEAVSLIDCNKSISALIAANTYYFYSVHLYDIEDFKGSKNAAETSLEYYRAYYGNDSIDSSSVLNELGSIYRKQDDLNKSIEYYEKSYNIRYGHLGDNNSLTATSLRNMARAHLTRAAEGDLDIAEEIYNKVLKIRLELSKNDMALGWLASAYSDIGVVSLFKGRFDDAIENFNIAIEYYIKTNQKSDVTVMKRYLGYAYSCKEDYPRAREYYVASFNDLAEQDAADCFWGQNLTSYIKEIDTNGKLIIDLTQPKKYI